MKQYSVLKHLILFIFLGLIASLLTWLCVYMIDHKHGAPPPPKEPMVTVDGAPRVLVVEIEKPIEKIVCVEGEDETILEFSEIDLLARLVHVEAGNQDMVGKRLIVDVVLNRFYSESFPNTIEDVIYAEGQFSTAEYLTSVEYTEEDLEAVYYELNSRIDTDVVYFRTENYHSCGKPLYQHNAHYFSGE